MTGLRTARLLLRPIDADLVALVDDPAAFHAAIGTRSSEPFPDPDLAGLLGMHARRLAADPTDHEWGPWLVIDAGRELPVGSAGFHAPPEPDGTVELGYGIAAPERRLGYATEAAEGLTRWALEQPGVTRVVARDVLADNEPSLRVLERLGYRRTREGDGTVDWEISA